MVAHCGEARGWTGANNLEACAQQPVNSECLSSSLIAQLLFWSFFFRSSRAVVRNDADRSNKPETATFLTPEESGAKKTHKNPQKSHVQNQRIF